MFTSSKIFLHLITMAVLLIWRLVGYCGHIEQYILGYTSTGMFVNRMGVNILAPRKRHLGTYLIFLLL
jgi:hypothetical protein